MIKSDLRREGNDLVITIPIDESERNGSEEGQWFAIQLTLLDTEGRPVLSGRLKEISEEIWERNKEALRYLADR
jgi:hypothetical protein